MPWILLTAGGLVLLVLVGAYICYRMTFYVPRKHTLDPHATMDSPQHNARKAESLRLIDEMLAIPCEEVSIVSFDGKRLFGRYYPGAPDAPIEILVHGYQGNAIRDLCGGLKSAVQAGHPVLLIDQRAHGKSEGRCLSFGILERRDCLCWIRYAAERFGEQRPMFLVGISMGASTVLMAAGLDLPQNVIGIVADSGYTSPEAIIRKVIREDRHLPDRALMPLVKLGALLYGGFRLNECSAPEALRRCRIPVLLIHGEDDRFVPCEMSRENKAACATATLLTIPDAGHGLGYLVDFTQYTETVSRFLREAEQHAKQEISCEK